MGKKFIFLALALLFGAQTLQGQITKITQRNGKTKIFKFNPAKLSASIFYFESHSEEGQPDFEEWWASGPGVRLSLSPFKPKFLFAYCDFSKYKYRWTNLARPGPPVFFNEQVFEIEAGLGMAFSLPLVWGFGLDAGAMVPVTTKPIPTISLGLSWEDPSESISIGFENLVKIDQTDLFNPTFYLSVSISSLFKRRKK